MFIASVFQIKICDEKDDPCLAEVKIPFDECLKPCEGLYLDVKKSPVNIVEEAQFQILLEDYLNYTWFQNDIDTVIENAGLQGNT